MIRSGAVLVLALINACAPGEAKDAGLGPEPTPELTTVTVAPASITLATGAATSFVASGTLEDGSTITPPVSWSANSGIISNSGAYTAPSVPGTYRVIATAVGTELADTSIVTVPSAPVTLTALNLVPGTVSVQTGVSQQFSISALWSNGGTTLPPVSFSATGGTVDGNGLFVAGGTPGTFRVIVSHNGGTLADTSSITIQAPPAVTLTNLVIIPGSVSLQTGASQQFAVAGTWSDGSTATPSVSYSATGGTINGSGAYTAGSTAGSYRVIALHAASGRADTSNVIVTAPPAATLVSLVLTPASASLNTGATRQFSIAAQWSDGSSSLPAVSYTATGGTISAGGLYTAGSTAGSFRVIVSHAASGLADTSDVTLSVPAPTLTSVSMTPASVSLTTGATQQFSTTAQWSDGSTTVPTLTYSATGGSVSANGLYTAGSSTGTFRVIVSANGRADTSAVTITAPAATISSVSITPATVSLQSGATQQFTASAQMSDGSTQNNPTLTWSATGGTINGSRLYTAGSTAGTYRVIATSSNGRADTSDVTVTAPTVVGLTVTPGTTSVTASATQQFSVVANLSNGGTQSNPSVTWSATGGSVSTGGLYTAGSSTGSFRVIVSNANGQADTANVTVTAQGTGPYANRPANFTRVITDYGFNNTLPTAEGAQIPNGDGWFVNNGAARMSIVADATSPTGSSVLQWRYAAGVGTPTSSAGFGLAFHSIPANTTKIYVAFSLWHDSNFEFNTISNKLFYLEPGNVILESYQAGMTSGWYSIYNGAIGTMYAPQINTPIRKGQWEQIEYLVDSETDNIKVWVDGQLRVNINTPMAGNWNELKLDSTWGGGAGPTTRDSYRKVDHILIATQ